eukprot:scaffold20399_cov60-Phaeocystis_antarctica.AAC.2
MQAAQHEPRGRQQLPLAPPAPSAAPSRRVIKDRRRRLAARKLVTTWLSCVGHSLEGVKRGPSQNMSANTKTRTLPTRPTPRHSVALAAMHNTPVYTVRR